VSLLLALAAAAQDGPLQPGTWRFETHARTATGPVCTEQWELRADWTMTVRGGEEVVEKRYRFRHDRDGDWIVAATLSSNGKPDCTGTVTRNPSKDEHSTYLVAFNDGHVEVCVPPGQAPDGSPYVSDCYATLRRVEIQH
jgi:Domain of unknown function (DUF1918)